MTSQDAKTHKLHVLIGGGLLAIGASVFLEHGPVHVILGSLVGICGVTIAGFSLFRLRTERKDMTR